MIDVREQSKFDWFKETRKGFSLLFFVFMLYPTYKTQSVAYRTFVLRFVFSCVLSVKLNCPWQFL